MGKHIEKSKNNLEIIQKMIKIIFKLSKYDCLLAAVVCMISAAMYPIILELNYRIVSLIEADISIGNKSVYFFVLLVLIFIISSSIFQITKFSNMLLFEKMQVNVGTSLMRKIYNKVSDLPHSFYDNPDNVAKLKRITLFSQDSMLTQNMIHIVSASCNLISLILIFPVLYKAGIEVFFLILIISIINNLFNFDEGFLRWEQQNKLEKMVIKKDKIRNYFFDKDAILEMRMLDSKKFFENKWEKEEDVIYSENYNFNKRMEQRKLLFSVIQLILKSIPLFVVAVKFSLKIVDVAIVFLVWQTQSQFSNVMSSVFDEFKAVHYSVEYIDELLSFLSNEVKNERMISKNIDTLISLNNVGFQYDGKNQVLHNISIDINAGEKIAIIGPNGAGKTTLIKILSGLYKPTSGQAQIGFEKMKLGTVWQDYVKFELSLRESIGLGNKKYMFNDKKIIDTINKLNLENLCDDLECIVGKSFDPDGIVPSGGQWQKIAVGRAVFGDKEIIFMDEPTASLDPISEVNLYNQIKKLFEHQTVIFVSHRVGFANLADKVIVVDNGRIIEDGTHSHLLENKGFYFSFFQEQLKWYRNIEDVSNEKI